MEIKKAEHWFESNINYFFSFSFFFFNKKKFKLLDSQESGPKKEKTFLKSGDHLHSTFKLWFFICISFIYTAAFSPPLHLKQCLWEFKELNTENLCRRHTLVEGVTAKLHAIITEIFNGVGVILRFFTFVLHRNSPRRRILLKKWKLISKQWHGRWWINKGMQCQ